MTIEWTAIFAALIGAFGANFASEYVKSLVRKSQTLEIERDELLIQIETSLDEMLEAAEDLWAYDASDKELGEEIILRAKIVGHQHYLLVGIAALLTGNSKRECDVKLTKLFDAISGGDFGSSNREKSEKNLVDVNIYIRELKHLTRKSRKSLPRKLLS